MPSLSLSSRQTDILIIGSGAAGLTAALQLADSANVIILSKSEPSMGSTDWAQGGIAAALDEEDTAANHYRDTMDAGVGLNHADAVKMVVENAPHCIEWLKAIGVPFDHNPPNETALHLTREGGHSHRRVAHVKDATGHAIESALLAKTLAHPNITILPYRIAIDLITTRKLGLDEPNQVLGIYVYDLLRHGVETFAAQTIILATGGAGKAYLYTSNPDTASGDGIAMAWRAGCRVGNLEFMQFHPTCLWDPRAKSFLISEALRGEGGHLVLPDGERFMFNFDARGELAPRDIVARAIDHEMKRLGLDYVQLDISHRPEDFIKDHFPSIYERCLNLGYDITREPIPVVPAAHYTCGGVCTDLHGKTDIEGLYAIGETAHTGLHGANRLASNSLLECLVFGQAAAKNIHQSLTNQSFRDVTLPPWDESRVNDADEEIVVNHNWDEIRRFMWDYVGIVRTNKRLERAHRRALLLQAEVYEYYQNFKISKNLLELRNLADIARLIVISAMARKESRGLHFNSDYPEANPDWARIDTVLTPDPANPTGATISLNPRP